MTRTVVSVQFYSDNEVRVTLKKKNSELKIFSVLMALDSMKKIRFYKSQRNLENVDNKQSFKRMYLNNICRQIWCAAQMLNCVPFHIILTQTYKESKTHTFKM